MAGRKMTPKGQMAFGGGPPITHLPPALKAMFQPGPPLPFKEKLRKRKCSAYGGLAAWTNLLETTDPPERIIEETPRDRRVAKKAKQQAEHDAKISEAVSSWDPHAPRSEIASATTTDAYKTLFVGRLSYETTEDKLRREFEQFGPVKALRMVTETGSDVENGHGKPRGYAFVEFEKESDMRTAYKRADGRKIDGRRILVDVERGRTVKHWKPRRLGGGLGGATRKGPQPKPTAPPAPARQPPAAPRYDRRPRSPPRRDSSRDRRDRYDRRGDDRDRYRDHRDRGDRDRDHRDRDHRDRGDRDRDRDRDRRRRDRSRSRDRSRRY
ncbi:hypothetical protein CTAYLR_000423 [Chrysophaeum taylorii]|uniref:U1 small nuclear ribonucleoprotein 70 kDa n=1 Tax=Chrysophaeum taylorii TaxID=2483200 RepID=A0AAD7UHL5_9STRA|nr:hypothetical protein CTAYLR_000423 [Chrysophaeum taylorii]